MAIDPQTYQPEQQQNLPGLGPLAPEELASGGAGVPLQPETGEFQVAGGKGSFLVDLLKAVGVTGRGGVDLPRTLMEENLPARTTAEGKPLTYRQERDAAAEALFSTEGHARWKGEREAKRQEAEQKIMDPDGLMDTAQQAHSYEQGALGGRVAPRAVDEEMAEELAEQLASPRERAVHLLEQDDFNLDQMTSPEEVQEVIAVLGERLKDPVEQAKRGVQEHEVTEGLAADLLADTAGFTKRMLKRRMGETLNAEEMTALRVLLQKSSSELDELAAKIAAGQGSPEDMIRFRRKMAITAGLYQSAKGAQTEIARAMNAFKIPVGMDPGDLRGELIMDMLKQSGGAGHAINLAKGYQKAVEKGGSAKGLEYANRGWSSKAKDVFLEVHINGLLSWFKSDMKNILGNAAFMTWRLPEDLLAGVFGAAERGILKGRRALGEDIRLEESVYMGETVARAWGYLQGTQEAFILAGRAFKSDAVPDIASKVEMSQFKAIDAERLGITNTPLARAVDMLGRVIRLPTTMLSSEDMFFKAISQRGELYAQAYQKSRNAWWNGESHEEAIDRGLEVMVDPRVVGKELDLEARYNTMTTDLGGFGKVTRWLQQSLIGRMVFPFVTAPTNTLVRAAERHPPLAAINPSTYKNLAGKNGPRARQKTMARLTMGAAASYAIYDLALQGRLTGGTPMSQKERDKLAVIPGWQPYSYVLRGDDFPVDEDGDELPLFDTNGVPNGPLKYWNYAGIEPIGAFVAMTVGAVERMERTRDPEVRENIWSALLLSTTEYIEQGMPFLQGMGAIIESIKYQNPKPLTDATTGAMLTVAPLPYSVLTKNIAGLTGDGRKRQIAQAELSRYTIEDIREMKPGPDGQLQYNLIGLAKGGLHTGTKELIVDTWQQQVLGLPFMRGDDEAVVRFDVLGQPIERVRFDVNPVQATWNSISPIRYTTSKTVPPYVRELIALDMPIGNPRRTFQGMALNNELRSNLIYLAKNEVPLPLSEGEGGSFTFRQALEWVLAGPATAQFHEEYPLLKDKQSALKRLETRYFEAAMKVLISIGPKVKATDIEGRPIAENPELRRAIGEREGLKAFEETTREQAPTRRLLE
jgi:hypothetical protein